MLVYCVSAAYCSACLLLMPMPMCPCMLQVYTVSVAPSFSAEAPCSTKNYTDGDVAITFSCDPDNAHRLIEMALCEMERLQVCRTPCTSDT